MSVERLYIGADVEVPYTGAYAEGAYLNSATVTYAIKDKTGATVTDGTGTCNYVAASNGNYLGVIESTVTAALTRGAYYRVEITLVSGAVNDKRYIECRAVWRGEE